MTIKGAQLHLSSAEEVARLEESLAARFPAGYAEFVTRFGEGTLGGSYVRIYPPHRIERELVPWRDRIRQYWFWPKGPCPQEHALESIILGDTLDGDELVFHPSNSKALFILPRHRECSFEAGHDLPEAIEWLCSSGTLTRRFSQRHFEPFSTR
jgi:hypothetical protein